MMENKHDIVVAGHLCLDITPRFIETGAGELAQMIKPGKLFNVEEAAISTGGVVSNTGLGLIKLGIKTALAAKIGNDFFGTGIRTIFKEHGADAALNMVDGEATSYSIVLAPPGIDRIFFHHPGTNDTFGVDDIDYDLVSRARIFHFGYPPLMKKTYENNGAELIEMFRSAKKLGRTTSLDMALPDPNSESGRVDWDKILSDLLPLVDIAPFSAEETMFMLDRRRFDELNRASGSGSPLDVFTADDFRRLGGELLARGAKIAVLKCGARGIMLFTAPGQALAEMGAAAPANLEAWASRELWEEPFDVDKIVSSTGAGDSAIAGFLAGFLRGHSPEETLAAACCAGAQNLQVLDAISGLHSWEETIAMIPGWKKLREQPGAGWRYDETQRVWRGPSDRRI